MMRPEHGIATDGAHSMKRGVTRYRAVDLATGELLFEQNIGNQTINIGEFWVSSKPQNTSSSIVSVRQSSIPIALPP